MEFAFSRLIIELVITILCLRNYRFYIINYIYANRQALGLEKKFHSIFFSNTCLLNHGSVANLGGIYNSQPPPNH
jgi:hypothetical protein